MPDGPLRHIVVPRDTILVKKTKQRLSVSGETLLVLLRHIESIFLALNRRRVELAHLLLESVEVFCSQPILVDRLDYGHNQILYRRDELQEFLIEGKLP